MNFRLSVVVIELPPLRQRPRDIPLCMSSFLAQFWTSSPRKRQRRQTP